jgi:hypothetical protein
MEECETNVFSDSTSYTKSVGVSPFKNSNTSLTLGSTSVCDEPLVHVDVQTFVEGICQRQCLVKEFVEDCVAGVRCEMVDLSNGLRRQAMYLVDANLTKFTIHDFKGTSESWLFTEIDQVVAAHKHDAVAYQRRYQLAHLKADEMRRAVAIDAVLHKIPGGVGTHFVVMLLEATKERCDRFVAAMRVLQLYAECSSDGTSPRSAEDLSEYTVSEP